MRLTDYKFILIDCLLQMDNFRDEDDDFLAIADKYASEKPEDMEGFLNSLSQSDISAIGDIVNQSNFQNPLMNSSSEEEEAPIVAHNANFKTPVKGISPEPGKPI